MRRMKSGKPLTVIDGVGFDGFSFGKGSPGQLHESFGKPTSVRKDSDDGDEFHTYDAGQRGRITFVFDSVGRLNSIQIDGKGNPVQTEKGVRIGDPPERVQDVYGRPDITPPDGGAPSVRCLW